MKKTKILIIRHGQSLSNLNKQYIGHMDLGLSDEGLRQAQYAADYHKNTPIDVIYSSDLKRAHDTAVPHSIIHGLPINDDVELRELRLGKWEGMKIVDIRAEYGDEFDIEWKIKFGSFRIPGGEVVYEGGLRFYNAVLRIARENVGKTILITAHAAVLRAFWGIVLGIMPEEIGKVVEFPTNASTSTLEFDGEKLIPIEYSFDEYIPPYDVPPLY